jgi:hypothetical protein
MKASILLASVRLCLTNTKQDRPKAITADDDGAAVMEALRHIPNVKAALPGWRME